MKSSRWYLSAVIAALFVLHNDFWLWSDRDLVAGLPVGLTYHLVYTALTVAAMALLVRLAWPHHLEDEHRPDGGVHR